MASKPNPLTLLEEQARSLGLKEIDLDDLVHDMKSEEASLINNNGLDSQLEALFLAYGYDQVKTMLDELK